MPHGEPALAAEEVGEPQTSVAIDSPRHTPPPPPPAEMVLVPLSQLLHKSAGFPT